jgi:hypothetical protein
LAVAVAVVVDTTHSTVVTVLAVQLEAAVAVAAAEE